MATNHPLLVPPRWSRRRLAGLLGGSLALLGPGLAADAARRKPRVRTKTRTFNNPKPITIRVDGVASPYPSKIEVSGFKRGKVLDVNVTLKNLSHEFPRDIDMLLVAPNGRRAIIMSDAIGTNDVENITLTLDDQAADPLPDSAVSGRFRPTNNDGGDPDTFSSPAPAGPTTNVKLATFRGINPNGTWKLFVHDDSAVDEGRIAGGWALRIKARVRE